MAKQTTIKRTGNVSIQTPKEVVMVEPTTVEPVKPKRTRRSKGQFPLDTAIDVNGNVIPLTPEGRLTAVPVNWSRKYAPLKARQFADAGHLYEWKAVTIDARIAALEKQKAEFLEQATEARQGPDPTKAKLRKLARLQRAFKELQEQLANEGVDLSDLD